MEWLTIKSKESTSSFGKYNDLDEAALRFVDLNEGDIIDFEGHDSCLYDFQKRIDKFIKEEKLELTSKLKDALRKRIKDIFSGIGSDFNNVQCIDEHKARTSYL